MESVDEIVKSLKSLRVSPVDSEYQLQQLIARQLITSGLTFQKEYKLGPRNRVDFFTEGIAIEVKRKKPNRNQVIEQLIRYAQFSEVSAIILVIDSSIRNIPSEVAGKPCRVIGLQKLWGLAI